MQISILRSETVGRSLMHITNYNHSLIPIHTFIICRLVRKQCKINLIKRQAASIVPISPILHKLSSFEFTPIHDPWTHVYVKHSLPITPHVLHAVIALTIVLFKQTSVSAWIHLIYSEYRLSQSVSPKLCKIRV